MRVLWLDPFRLGELDDRWDDLPRTPAIYAIRRGRPIPRIGGVDRRGILYIGKSLNLRNRLWQFWYAHHTASGFLWTDPAVASVSLGRSCRTEADVERRLGELLVRAAAPLPRGSLAEAERATLFAYVRRFGEPPPLNFSLPGRWDLKPTATLLRWADVGLL